VFPGELRRRRVEARRGVVVEAVLHAGVEVAFVAYVVGARVRVCRGRVREQYPEYAFFTRSKR
jgi:hypothetical protein